MEGLYTRYKQYFGVNLREMKREESLHTNLIAPPRMQLRSLQVVCCLTNICLQCSLKVEKIVEQMGTKYLKRFES